jgi:hypothetical protein
MAASIAKWGTSVTMLLEVENCHATVKRAAEECAAVTLAP